ncbi:MAG TPA: phosphatase PAP2 family protein [Anaeromyxobacteraceae bacterium]|nr:phosphatase PAP2 family protein [Anaeromyxobacteraceae bacterium]
MRVLSSRGLGIGFGLLVCAILWLRWRHLAFRSFLALGLAMCVSDFAGSRLIRPIFARMRPCYALPPGTFRWLSPAANGPSLPSLHAANTFALALVATLSWPKLALVAYPFAIAVSLSRVYVGVHWPTDVLAGAAWGTVSGLLAWLVSRILARHFPRPQGDGASSGPPARAARFRDEGDEP